MKVMTKNVKWMADVLNEWLEAMKSGGETNDLIQKFCKEDEFKANVYTYINCNIRICIQI